MWYRLGMNLTDQPEEILDLTDDNDIVIGQIEREEAEKQGLSLPGHVRAVDCFWVNSHSQIFIPVRLETKRIAPGGYDFSAAEHVQVGESYIDAIVRGFDEELNMKVEPSQFQELTKIDFKKLGVIPYFDTIFLYRSDDTPPYNPNDFSSHEWLTVDEVLHNIQNGHPAKKTLAIALETVKEKLQINQISV